MNHPRQHKHCCLSVVVPNDSPSPSVSCVLGCSVDANSLASPPPPRHARDPLSSPLRQPSRAIGRRRHAHSDWVETDGQRARIYCPPLAPPPTPRCLGALGHLVGVGWGGGAAWVCLFGGLPPDSSPSEPPPAPPTRTPPTPTHAHPPTTHHPQAHGSSSSRSRRHTPACRGAPP